MGWLFVKRRMKSELGNNWQDKFLSFSKDAVSSASLGQVHKASINNKKKLAVKLQYPNMKSVIDADLKQLKLVFRLYRNFDKSISTVDIHRELEVRLNEELDYERERKNIKVYDYIFKNHNDINIPKSHKSLSTKRLLTMDWLEVKILRSLNQNQLI